MVELNFQAQREYHLIHGTTLFLHLGEKWLMHPSLALASSLDERAEADPGYLLVGKRGGQELHHSTVFVDGSDGNHALPTVVVERLSRENSVNNECNNVEQQAYI